MKNKWITQDVKQLINLKSDYCKKWRNGEISRAENNKLKNKINFRVNSAKNEYYKNAFTVYRKNMEKSWNLCVSYWEPENHIKKLYHY